ncbi:MAG: DUF362 domain-containing protein [Promethearchaeota archaeon]
MTFNLKGKVVDSAIGNQTLDKSGSAIGVSRMDVEKAYKDVSKLLQKVINEGSEEAWTQVKTRIDYIYDNVSEMLTSLDQETNFLANIKERISNGQKILFKPNLVSSENINPYNHGSAFGSNAMTEWPLVAAVLRWFHDKAGISYYKMSIGEGATTSAQTAAHYTYLKRTGRAVTTEAVIEGRSDDFYGGYGFYFVRKYLSEESDNALNDNPMNGLEESMARTFIPPGSANDKLMVYDLNKISDPSRGREIPVPNGGNFETLTLHKVAIGGDPSNPEDKQLYPEPILINISKLKVHTQSLITNVLKNIGIGLYSMEVLGSSDSEWKYSKPDSKIPGLRSLIPHQIWIPEQDPITYIPQKDINGRYIVKKTGGLTDTILDMVKGVANQGIFMLHIVDSIEAVNLDHQGIGYGRKVSEGLTMASLDPVALDLMCSRYLFSNVGLKLAKEAGLEDGAGGLFAQAVPIPRYEGGQIITEMGFDCPIKREIFLKRAEEEKLGVRKYYIVGQDALTNNPLASLGGRLGYVQSDFFNEIVTKTLYYDIYKVPWDLQKTFFSYLDAIEKLEGKSLKQKFLDTYDEERNGIVSYEEFGKKGLLGTTMFITGHYMSARGAKDESESYRTLFATLVTRLRNTNPKWNPEGHHIQRENAWGSVALVGLNMYQNKEEKNDPFVKDLKWGKGKWPSFSFAQNIYVNQQLYGYRFPKSIGVTSLYGCIFCNADYTLNDSEFIGSVRGFPRPDAVDKYFEAIKSGNKKPFDFTFYVPIGYGGNGEIPNVQETSDPEKILTAEFNKASIRWPDARPPVFQEKYLNIIQ